MRSFTAKFTGFAWRLKIYESRLYITQADEKLEKAISAKRIPFTHHKEMNTQAYLNPRFDVYFTAYATVGSSDQGKKVSLKPFKVQVSQSSGDFTTPDFGEVELSNFNI